jgi:multicomponent Na+:H+ antiporter subunit C
MNTLLALIVGVLYAAGFYLIMSRSIVKLIIGLALLSHAANLLIFAAAGMTRGRAPLIAENATMGIPPFADPLPQALILTAIVISFGVLAFAMVLIYRAYQSIGTDDVDAMKGTEQ